MFDYIKCSLAYVKFQNKLERRHYQNKVVNSAIVMDATRKIERMVRLKYRLIKNRVWIVDVSDVWAWDESL